MMVVLATLALSASFLDGDRWVQVEEERPINGSEWRARFIYPDGSAHEVRYGAAAIVRLREGSRPPVPACALTECLEDELRWTPLMPSARLWRVERAEPERQSGAVLAAQWSRDARARYAVPEMKLARTSHRYAVDDPRAPDQWYLDGLRLRDAWALEDGSSEVTIAVVDNGCDLAHPDLAFTGGRDTIERDNDPSHPAGSTNGHGTACAGLAAARTNNAEGIAGTCPGCSSSCIRLLTDDDTPVPLGADLAAFDYALRSGAAVVSNSWGFSQPIPVPAPLRDAINTVYDEGRDGLGAVVVFAVGNDGRQIENDELLAVRGVLGVGGINQFDETASFSNRGEAVDLVAPVGTVTTDISGPDGFDAGDYTNRFGGTSSACPIAAGIAGLVLSAHPNWTAEQAVEHLLATARAASLAIPDASGRDPFFGRGVIDPVAALAPPTPATPEAPEEGGCRQISGALLLCLTPRRLRRR